MPISRIMTSQVEAEKKTPLRFPWWVEPVTWICLFLAAWFLFSVLPYNEASDWVVFYTQPGGLGFYPPWTQPVLNLFSWDGGRAFFMALSSLLVGGFTWRSSHNRIAVAMAWFNFPMLVGLMHGSIDALLLLGLAWLPWGVPFVLMKPQVVVWALLARGRWVVIAGIFGLLSLLIWGLWPLEILSASQGAGALTSVHTVTTWRLGPLFGLAGVGLFLVTLLRDRDPDRLMCAGVLFTPYALVNHYIPLLPAMGRVRPWQRWLLWGLAWLPLALMNFTDEWRMAILLYPLVLWIFLEKPGQPAPWGTELGSSWLDRLEKKIVQLFCPAKESRA